MQETVKEILISIDEAGLTKTFYFLPSIISMFFAFPLFIWLSHKMNIGRLRAFWAMTLFVAMYFGCALFVGWVEASLGLGNYGRKNGITVYIWLPLICYITAKILKIEYGTLCTVTSPISLFIQGILHIGCLFSGCCKGFECAWGVYNVSTGDFRFPMPIVEGGWKIVFSIVLLYILKRRGYKPANWLYPLMIFVLGVVTFISEFYVDNDKIVGNLSLRSFHSMSLIIVGGLWLLVLYRSRMKILEKKNRFRKKDVQKKPLY